jgi:hypothetical protein
VPPREVPRVRLRDEVIPPGGTGLDRPTRLDVVVVGHQTGADLPRPPAEAHGFPRPPPRLLGVDGARQGRHVLVVVVIVVPFVLLPLLLLLLLLLLFLLFLLLVLLPRRAATTPPPVADAGSDRAVAPRAVPVGAAELRVRPALGRGRTNAFAALTAASALTPLPH